MIFAFLYFTFLGPLLVALATEIYEGTDCSAFPPPAFPSFCPLLVRDLALWLLYLMACYITLRTGAQWLHMKVRRKTHAVHMEDGVCTMNLALALAVTSGIVDRFQRDQRIGILWGMTQPGAITMYLMLFTAMFEVIRYDSIQLSASMKHNPVAIISVGIALAALVMEVFSCIRCARAISDEFYQAYLALMAVTFVMHLFAFWPKKFPFLERHYLHIHHWYWPLPFVQMSVFNSDVSIIGQSMFLAVWIHGFTAFGLQPNCYDTYEEANR